MDITTQQLQNDSFRFILWGILLIKCLILEYLASKYAVPVNTTIYVWSLSVFMGLVATIAHIKLRLEESGKITSFSLVQLTWLLGVLAGTGTTILNSQTTIIADQAHLPILAALLGVCYCTQGLIEKKLGSIASGFGWWIGAAILFRTAPLNDYLVFAICIFLFSVMPTLLEFLRRRRTSKQQA